MRASRLIERYFDAFPRVTLFPDVAPTLDRLAERYRLAVVSNIDDDLLRRDAAQADVRPRLHRGASQGLQARRHLFRYLISRAGCGRDDILHSGQSQFTDMVGGKPLGLTIAWINRRGIALRAACAQA